MAGEGGAREAASGGRRSAGVRAGARYRGPDHRRWKGLPAGTLDRDRSQARSLALEAAAAAASKKAERIVILDVSAQLAITDFFVICSGSSDRQVRTIAQEVERRLGEDQGIKPFRREGEREGHWVLLDYVDFVVHVFQPEHRDYFDLERLWADAERVPFSEGGPEEDEGNWRNDEPAAAEAT